MLPRLARLVDYAVCAKLPLESLAAPNGPVASAAALAAEGSHSAMAEEVAVPARMRHRSLHATVTGLHPRNEGTAYAETMGTQ